MYGVKVILKALVLLLVVCTLATLWCDKSACGVFTAKCVMSLFVIIAIIAEREVAKL